MRNVIAGFAASKCLLCTAWVNFDGQKSCVSFYIPNRPYNVIGYLDATTAPIRRRGVVAFAARRAKELGADAIVVLAEGQEYAGASSTGNAYATGFL